MQRPVKGYPHWSAYHRRHRFHRSFLAGSFVLTLLTLLSLGSLYVQTTSASQVTLFTLDIVDPNAAQVVPASGGISGSGGGSLFEPSPILNQPKLEPKSPATNFVIALVRDNGTDDPDAKATESQAQTKIPVVTTNPPRFRGRVGVANAILVLELHSSPSQAITSTIKADDTGSWEFTPPHALINGAHILYVSVFDMLGQFKLGSSILQFIVASDASGNVALPPAQPGPPPQSSLFAQGQLLFDVRATIPEAYRSINPGQDLLVQLDLVNLSAGQRPTDVSIHYKIRNQKGDVFLDQTETLAVPQAGSFIRLFRTAYRLPPDQYVFETSLPYNDGRVEAFSSDQFTVKGEPVIGFPGGAKVNVNVALQGLGLLLAFFAGITYYEFKQVEGLAKIIHHITDHDLLSKGLIVR